MKAIRVHKSGGPEVLSVDQVDIPKLTGPKDILVKNHAIGVNYIDTYHRTGVYKLELPAILGRDGAGVVEAVGTEVTDFKVGDRVAYVFPKTGSYAEYTLLTSTHTYKLPDDVSFEVGCAAMIQGLTGLKANYLVRGSYHIKKGDTVLVHAAAGGAGQFLVQEAKLLGARVIGTVSTEEKAKLVKELGCDEVIIYTQKDFVEETLRLTNGNGVQAVYDSVGKDTLVKSFAVLARRGIVVLYGASSGKPDPIDPAVLAKGSYFLTRPSLGDYIVTREEFVERTNQVIDWVRNKQLKVEIGLVVPLQEAAKAHTSLEGISYACVTELGRRTTGKIILQV